MEEGLIIKEVRTLLINSDDLSDEEKILAKKFGAIKANLLLKIVGKTPGINS